jgi:hypothetical protein
MSTLICRVGGVTMQGIQRPFFGWNRRHLCLATGNDLPCARLYIGGMVEPSVTQGHIFTEYNVTWNCIVPSTKAGRVI